ncbi:MAG: hypothetical protein ABSF22_10540 [Bryobacteraceae bacterium]
MLGELADILFRSKFEKKIAASLLSIDQLVDLYAGFAALVRPVPVPRLADLLVTGDRLCCCLRNMTVDGLFL